MADLFFIPADFGTVRNGLCEIIKNKAGIEKLFESATVVVNNN
jgi:hypothetical protein